jgi:hypothetical protein
MPKRLRRSSVSARRGSKANRKCPSAARHAGTGSGRGLDRQMTAPVFGFLRFAALSVAFLHIETAFFTM